MNPNCKNVGCTCDWNVICHTCNVYVCVDCTVEHKTVCKAKPKKNMNKTKPNEKCKCGSGKKYKKCCKKWVEQYEKN